MSTIERAAARLGAVGKVPAETMGRRPTVDAVNGVGGASTQPSVSRVGGGVCEIDLDALAASGFATQRNTQSEIAADLRRIKRQLMLKIKQAEALGHQTLAPNLVLITSSLAGEGKTFVAINLALSLAAEVDRSVLLVDADVMKSDVGRVLGVSSEVGLTDLLQRDTLYVENAVLQTNISGLSLLLSGPQLSNADELFASDKMAELLRDLAQHDSNRIVIIDSPPLHAGTEASVLGRMVGRVVVLVEADRTPEATVAEALHHLSGCESVSLVLNKARRRSREHVGYGYGYGYGRQEG